MARSTLIFCPLQAEGSFQTQREAGRQFSALFTLSKPHSILDIPTAPRLRRQGQTWGQVGPHCALPCLSHPQWCPPCAGDPNGVLCHRLHKDFFLNRYSGISVLQGGKWWLPALPRILLQTKHLGGYWGDSCDVCWFLGVSQAWSRWQRVQCKVDTFPRLPLPFGLQEGPSERGFHISLAKPHPHSKRSR